MVGQQEKLFAFNQTSFNRWGLGSLPQNPDKVVTGVAVGDNTYVRTGGTMVGSHNYRGKIGDITVNTDTYAGKRKAGLGIYSTTIGANSFTNGTVATTSGALNVISSDYDGTDASKATKNFGATINGSLNSIESATSSDNVSGLANAVVGTANRTFNSNGSLVFGAGNEITNSISAVDTSSVTGSVFGGPDSVTDMANNLRGLVKDSNSGGATLAIGGGNTADWAQTSQLIGVNNTLKGTSSAVSQYNMIDGYKNTATDVKNVSVIGSENTVSSTNSAVVLGDKRTLSSADGSIIMGSSKNGTTTSVKNAVAIGSEANVTKEGGVALGAKSIAGRGTDEDSGYDLSTKASSTDSSSTWKPTDAAVSVGDGTTVTRRIISVAAGLNDTDAVNVAQLKKATEAATNGAVTKGFALSDDAGTPVLQPLGEAIQLKGENGIVTTADATSHKITISMGDDVKVGKDGKNGQPGVNGTIGVNGGDGKSSVGINGKDGISVKGDKGEVGINGNDGISIKGEAGKDGSIGLSGKDGISVNGKDGKPGVTITAKDGSDGHIGINGKDGSLADISVKNGAPGVNGTDGITRIVYEDKTGNPHEIATLDDGMKYAGDMGAGDDSAKKVIAKKLNQQVNVVGGITKAADVSTENNIGVISDGTDNLTLRLAKNLKGLDSVTAGTVVVGKDKDGKNYVTGLDNTTWNGTAVSGRAATEDQLKAVADSVATTVGNGKLIFKGDTGSVDKKLGDTVAVTGDSNVTTKATDKGVEISLNKNVDLGTDGSIKAGNTTINKDGITTNTVTATTVRAGDTTVTTDGMTINGGPSITKTNVDMGSQQIHNVKDGSDPHDAATVGQVDKKVSEGTKNVSITGGTIGDDGFISLTKGDNSKVTLDGKLKDISAKAGIYDITGGKVTIGMQDNYSKKDAGNIVINDVAKASDLTKEVSDRKAADKVITNTIGAESPEKLKETFKDTSYIKDSGSLADADKALDKAISSNTGAINNLNGKVDRLGTRVNRVGAGAAALAALHPLDFDPDDKWDVAAGYGNYKDANAVAIGAFYRPNEDTLLSVGGSFGGGENMVNAGVSLKLGQGNHVSTSRVAMAKEIKALTEKVSVLESALAKSTPSSLPDGGKNVLFPDVSENHWAYEYVTGLAKEGILEGYPDGTFGGDRMMTRYEFAAMVYRLMQSGKVGQSSDMDRLVKEFTPELQYIRIDTVSKHKDGTPDIQRVRVIKEAKK